MSSAGELSGQTSNASDRFPHDPLGFFIEPAWCVEALVRFEAVHGGIPAPAWDPAAGSGTIPLRLMLSGVPTLGSDVVDRVGRFDVLDFLGTVDEISRLFEAWDCRPNAIVCNPPYGEVAERFILRALDLVPYVAMLVQAKFVYSQGRHRRIFSPHPPARIVHLSTRPSMPPGDLLMAGEINPTGGKMDFLWIVWDKRQTGPTTAHWLAGPEKPARMGRGGARKIVT